MTNKNYENIVREFNKTGKSSLDEVFELNGQVYIVKIEKKSKISTENFILNKAQNISALGSGSPCGCCNGTGRS